MVSSRGNGEGQFEIYNDIDATSLPDKDVHCTESAIISSIVSAPEKVLRPPRPGYGKCGQSNILQTNYLNMVLEQRTFFCYKIHIANALSSEIPGAATARRLISILLAQRFSQEHTLIATDYLSALVSCVDMPCGRIYRVMDTVRPSGSIIGRRRIYRVYLTKTCKFSSEELMRLLTHTGQEPGQEIRPGIIPALDVILSHFRRMKPLTDWTMLDSGMKVLRHLAISAHAAAARILVSVEVQRRPYYRAGLLSAIMHESLSNHRAGLDSLEKILTGVRIGVVAPVRRGGPSGQIPGFTDKIIMGFAKCTDGALLRHPPRIAHDGAGPQDVELFEELEYISLKAYIEREWCVALSPDLPVLNVGTAERPIYVPADICVVKPRQLVDTESSPRQRWKPERPSRQDLLSEIKRKAAAASSNELSNPTLTAFGIQLSSDFVSVYSRVLAAPRIIYARGVPARVVHGGWSLGECRVVKPVALRSWSWIYLDLSSGDGLNATTAPLNNFLDQLAEKLQRMGANMSVSTSGEIVQLAQNSAWEQIKGAVATLKAKHRPSMILIIFPRRAQKLVHLARLACDIIHGVPSVEVKEEWLANAEQEMYGRIGLRINLKLGGTNHVVGPPGLDFFSNGMTMIVGIHVAFVPPPSTGGHSNTIVGLVASFDRRLAQWPVELRVQSGRTRFGHNVNDMLETQLRAWVKRHNNRVPEDIVIFRNVASNGNEAPWIEQELPLLQDACRRVSKTVGGHCILPRIAVVFVDENHHAQFFPTVDTEGDKFGCPLPGTIIDRGISPPRQWEFFLQSQVSVQPMDRPPHYVVIYDEVFRRRCRVDGVGRGPADLLQGLTHTLCYLCGESTKARGICAPLYYARQACARVCLYSQLVGVSQTALCATAAGNSSSIEIHPAVRETMFYL